MRIFLCLRNTQDWENISINDLFKKSNVFHKCSTYFKNIRRWQKYVTPNYFEYRIKLKKIAMSQWNLPWLEYSENFLDNLDDDDLIVPVDDDDWFHPEFEKFLIKNSKNFDFGYWGAIVNQTSNNYNIHEWYKFNDYVCSNSYFLKVSFLRSQSIEKTKELIKDHFKASDLIRSN